MRDADVDDDIASSVAISYGLWLSGAWRFMGDDATNVNATCSCPEMAALGPFLPDHREMHDGLHRLFHVLNADPFQPGVEGVFAGEDVGAGQAHERQPRAVGPTTDGARDRLEARAADRLDRMVDDLRMPVDDLFHVAVLRPDLEPIGRARKTLHDVAHDALQQRLFFLQAGFREVANDEAERGFFQSPADSDRMQEALLALGRLRRAGIPGQALDDGRGDLDGMLHLALGKTGMGADALDRDGGAIGGEGFVLDMSGGLAVHRVGEFGAQFLDVDLVDATADFL